ncbi:MAG: TlpA family protein disulfide reductase [Lunatimonas sp.]|uniref:TlpA family protein disulfide reductase n=1 Tax=Lunatimonas sp. TaxID=2060141 RepID=UPI00263AD151|nr:TlpA disulfide reductase family protein [Lunatimonas sp.]MCC5936071.1 TlpA family protein disulfide reductase [Lunatimonas sp.]
MTSLVHVWMYLSIVIGGLLLPAHLMDSVRIISFEEFEKMANQSSDKLVIYNFWATWCAPCVKEMPAFEKVNAENADIDLVFISLDDGRRPERVDSFIERRGIKAPVFLLNDVDFNSWIDKVNKDWSGAIPATLFVQSDGKRFFHEGELDEDALINLITKLK